jgi:hypothetical protein
MSHGNSSLKSMNGFGVRLAGAKLFVSGKMPGIAISEVSLFDVSGKRIPLALGRGVAEGRGEVASVQFDISKLARGMYVVRVKAGSIVQSATFVY